PPRALPRCLHPPAAAPPAPSGLPPPPLSLLPPPPPRSPLFPYTTLFRSQVDAQALHLVAHQVTAGFDHGGVPALGQRGADWDRRDRKSTRLNSSHVSISYAVFCVKKKKVRRGVREVGQTPAGHCRRRRAA